MNAAIRKGPIGRWRSRVGFTLAELLITIAIIGVLAGIGITQFRNILPAVRSETTIDSANFLNRGVQHYNQVNSEISIAAASDTSDEMAVMALLKTRAAALPGSPYIPPEFSSIPSSDIDKIRLYWTGRFFRIIPEGAAGAGIIVNQ